MLKRFVDSYEEGKLIPKCQFTAKITFQEEEDIPPLEHHVNLIGTKFPFNYLRFDISPAGKLVWCCVCLELNVQSFSTHLE